MYHHIIKNQQNNKDTLLHLTASRLHLFCDRYKIFPRDGYHLDLKDEDIG